MPLQGIKHGGGSCSDDTDCGSDLFDFISTDIDAEVASADALDTTVDALGASSSMDNGDANLASGNKHHGDKKHNKGRGECVRKKCRCTSTYYAGPHCLVS